MNKQAKLTTEFFKINDLIPADYNPRKDLSKSDIEYQKIRKSIEEFDYVEPLIFNKRTNTLISGHQRLKVLKDLKYDNVEVTVVNLDLKKEKALNLAMNKIHGDWDDEKLINIIEDLKLNENFNIEITGFNDNEINALYKNTLETFNIIDNLEAGVFNNSLQVLSGIFNVTFSFPIEHKTLIQQKLKNNGKEYYNSKMLEVFNA